MLAVVLGSSRARAACSKDVECEGDAICEDGRCVAPLPPAPTATADQTPTPGQAPAAATGHPETVPPVPVAKPAPVTVPQPKPARRIKSPGLLIGGITLATLGAASLWTGVYMGFRNGICNVSEDPDGDLDCPDGDLALGLVGLGLVVGGGSVPLIVMGARKEPVPQRPRATLRPWFGARGGGVNVQLDL